MRIAKVLACLRKLRVRGNTLFRRYTSERVVGTSSVSERREDEWKLGICACTLLLRSVCTSACVHVSIRELLPFFMIC